MNPLVKLAAGAVPGEKKFALFAGAGLSKDAGLPTSWDLMMATAALLRAAEGGKPDEDVQEWFLNSKYASMRYADLVGSLFPSPVEQQSFLREKLKTDKPAEAHRLIAELARRDVIRFIITTNFDNLLEGALQEAGLTVQVLANEADFEHSEPLIHCKAFRVYKPHGTIGVGRIRNTPADIEKLPEVIEEELVRVLSDHGLIVLGYGGWDEGIVRIFQRRRSVFPVFWVTPSEPRERVRRSFDPAQFTYIGCKSASGFLIDLLTMYRRLAEVAPTSSLPAGAQDAREAIAANRADLGPVLRRFMNQIIKEVDAAKPDYSPGEERDERLVKAIDQTKSVTSAFASVSLSAAEMNSAIAATELLKGLSGVLDKYQLPRGFSGAYRETDFDYYKFLGHELCVTLFQHLIKEGRWEVVGQLLREDFYLENPHLNGPDCVQLDYVSRHLALLDERGKRLGTRSLWTHAQVLESRHSEGSLGEMAPFPEFVDADVFLFMASPERETGLGPRILWRPWSVLKIDRVPRFLVEAGRSENAAKISRALQVGDVTALRGHVAGRLRELGEIFREGLWHHVFARFDAQALGTR